MDSFFTEYIVPYIETIDSKIPDEENIFHVPVMLGGYYAYSEALPNFRIFDHMLETFTKVSRERFNIPIYGQFSTANEFLDEVKK